MHKLASPLLRSLASFVLLCAWGSAVPSQVRAEAFCALTLHVEEAPGDPFTSTWVELVNSSGRTVLRQMMRGPELKICDFGFGPHTLRVGTNECFPVAISGLKVVLDAPIELHVILNPCVYREVMHTGCSIYFRSVDDDHAALPDVQFSPAINLGRPSTTDAFGRWQGLFRRAYDLTFTKPGFQPSRIHIQCHDGEDVEQEVVLKRAGASPPTK
jgi:hypothetical protein